MWPPHRSTTGRPFSMTAVAAPTSPRLSKFAANAARTFSNRGSHCPSIDTIARLVPRLVPSHNTDGGPEGVGAEMPVLRITGFGPQVCQTPRRPLQEVLQRSVRL